MLARGRPQAAPTPPETTLHSVGVRCARPRAAAGRLYTPETTLHSVGASCARPRAAAGRLYTPETTLHSVGASCARPPNPQNRVISSAGVQSTPLQGNIEGHPVGGRPQAAPTDAPWRETARGLCGTGKDRSLLRGKNFDHHPCAKLEPVDK